MRFLIYIISFVIISFSSPVRGQSPRVDQQLQKLMEQTNTVGLAAAVVKKNKVVFVASYGYKNWATKEKLNPTDLFRIASISKSFTATAIMQLVDQKKLNLTDDIADLMGIEIRNPNFPDKKITLQMLLSHTSSLNDKEGYFSLDAIIPDKNPNWKNAYNTYAPGENYQYCNLNFNLLGALLERITGERFDEYIHSKILSPLGLTGGYNVNNLNPQQLVNLYEYNPTEKDFKLSEAAYAKRTEEINNYKMGYSAPIFSPTGGMKISATDLAKYMQLHMNYGKAHGKRLLSKKSAQLMQTPVNVASQYGLALTRSKSLVNGQELVGHTGSAYGLFSLMFFNPKEKYGIVLITNGSSGGYEDGFNKILKQSYNLLYQEIIL